MPGLWVGTNVEGYSYPGNCTIVKFRDYPPQYSGEGALVDALMSDFGQPLTYRITPGGTIRFGSGCVWVRISS
ncbi:hypothetical protein MPRG_24090 [Mycobacterium paragordonae]|uniref:Uncharacterized protein n=2 Tax=Mycobacterium paragordonae TaxID=1389713 RepID=A0ABQ1C3V5_9MYCO|nr:hypothetical protein MPRG_24090 [Mycobacterium paragordonae]